MIYTIQDMTRDVKACIDQNMSSEQLLQTADIDTLSLDEIVRSKIPTAVRQVHMAAPLHMLEQGHNFGDSVFWESDRYGWVPLPQDFMRLMCFRMSDWEKAVHTAISPADPEYALQRQRVPGLRGNPQKPVCAITTRPQGRVLEFYSCRSREAYVQQGQYVPWAEVDRDGGIDISGRCHDAAIYAAASLVLTTIGEPDKAAAMSEITKSMLT